MVRSMVGITSVETRPEKMEPLRLPAYSFGSTTGLPSASSSRPQNASIGSMAVRPMNFSSAGAEKRASAE